MKFREWLLSAPSGAGELWDSGTNADGKFAAAGVPSKYRTAAVKYWRRRAVLNGAAAKYGQPKELKHGPDE